MESSGYMEIVQAVFRWLHVIAGITWIGHLYFFNFVNSQLVKTYDADSKKKVLPELMPRALYFFRWGAAYTFITGFLLLGMVYYMGGYLLTAPPVVNVGIGSLISVLLLVVGFGVYDMLWKSALGKNEMVASVVSLVLVMGVTVGLGRVYSGRSVLIHIGAMYGTIMAANVWMRIWPAQKKIIAGVKGTAPAPDASVAALAGLRSKHNTYLSMPLVFLMISNHYTSITGMVGADHDIAHDFGWLVIAVVTLIGWGLAKRLYMISATPETKWIGDTAAAPTPPPAEQPKAS